MSRIKHIICVVGLGIMGLCSIQGQVNVSVPAQSDIISAETAVDDNYTALMVTLVIDYKTIDLHRLHLLAKGRPVEDADSESTPSSATLDVESRAEIPFRVNQLYEPVNQHIRFTMDVHYLVDVINQEAVVRDVVQMVKKGSMEVLGDNLGREALYSMPGSIDLLISCIRPDASSMESMSDI